MHVQRVGNALDGDFLVERMSSSTYSRLDAPCSEAERGRLLQCGVIGKVCVTAVFDAANQAAVDLRHIDIAILTRKNLDGNFVLPRIADNLVDTNAGRRLTVCIGRPTRMALTSSGHWSPAAKRWSSIMSRRFSCVGFDCRLVAAHRLREQRVFFALHCHASRHYVLAHPRHAGTGGLIFSGVVVFSSNPTAK
jgi:hypothetical protein